MCSGWTDPSFMVRHVTHNQSHLRTHSHTCPHIHPNRLVQLTLRTCYFPYECDTSFCVAVLLQSYASGEIGMGILLLDVAAPPKGCNRNTSAHCKAPYAHCVVGPHILFEAWREFLTLQRMYFVSLLAGLWNFVFLFSNLSLVFFLPFAYFFTESEGFAGSKKVH